MSITFKFQNLCKRLTKALGIFCLLPLLNITSSKAQLFTEGNNKEFNQDPIEKTKRANIVSIFKDRRFDLGSLLYMNFFSDINVVVFENPSVKLYKPEISKKLVYYFLDNLAEINENVIQGYFERGLDRIDSGKYDLAMSDFDKALLYDPENADAYLNRGVLFIYSEQYPEALEELEKAEKYDNKNAGIFFNRGLVYYDTGKYNEALSQFDQCIKLDDNYTRAYFQKGLALDALGRYDEAINSLKKAKILGNSNAADYIKKIKEKKKGS